MTTSATDIFLAAYAALAPEEQEETFAKITAVRLNRLALDDSETGRFIRSLRRVAEYVGRDDLSPDDYRAARANLVAAGEDIPEINAVIRHFESWRHEFELQDEFISFGELAAMMGKKHPKMISQDADP